MREDCKFFQRRMSRAGDPVSFCALDLAPEAPWRCPEDCRRYEKVPGTRDDTSPGIPHEALAAGAAGVLGSAEEIIGRLAPELEAEEQRQEKARRVAEDKWWNRLRRSPRWRR
jgi:hypothetical protein